MKKHALILLRGGVFSLGAVLAFAFTEPITQQTVWGEDPEIGVRQVTLGSGEYRCDQATVQCLYSDQAMQNPLPNSEGQFIYLGPSGK
ncbi:hypothetical protein [Anditalea andensis]|uniref:Uncharacterized protein n=1 Tax=Anditalea andensis TaxID=1048983 RepID=A0A074KRW0_9BACT|nr:hypothetical protein [Anditalea andensis]KEO71609.1 hypothetical protein EL17_23980 [Anditalea andensis]